MVIHLLTDHTAILANDGKSVITIDPETEGELEIQGHRFRIKSGVTPVVGIPGAVGMARVIFEDKTGIRYVGIRPFLEGGIPYTRADFTHEYVKLRVHMDEMERRMDKLAEGYHELCAEQGHNALGILFNNTRNKEDKKA